MTAKPVVLFLCIHNAGRSLAAKVLLNHYAAGQVDVRSAGSEPAGEPNPSVAAVLNERGLDPSREFPKPLTDELAQAADVVVTMGCGDTCPFYRIVDSHTNAPRGCTDTGERGVHEMEDIAFDAEGVILRGWLLRPTSSQVPAPVVVMTHGYNCLKEFYLDTYAESIVDAGHVGAS